MADIRENMRIGCHVTMVKQYKSGMSLRKIGDLNGVSKQAVHQIIRKAGVERENAGASKAAKLKEEARLQKKEQDFYDKYGCTIAEYHKINKNLDSKGVKPSVRYSAQRKRAEKRGVEWDFDLKSWWAEWKHSGKWLERGYCYGEYVMARSGDIGPYSPVNIRITTVSKNLIEYWHENALR